METFAPSDLEPELVSEIEDIFTDVYIAPTACQGIGQPCSPTLRCCFRIAVCDQGICEPIFDPLFD